MCLSLQESVQPAGVAGGWAHLGRQALEVVGLGAGVGKSVAQTGVEAGHRSPGMGESGPEIRARGPQLGEGRGRAQQPGDWSTLAQRLGPRSQSTDAEAGAC